MYTRHMWRLSFRQCLQPVSDEGNSSGENCGTSTNEEKEESGVDECFLTYQRNKDENDF